MRQKTSRKIGLASVGVLLIAGLMLAVTGPGAGASPAKPEEVRPGICEQFTYTSCPTYRGCAQECVPSSCTRHGQCTADCDGPGSCYTP